jgi:putative FmdB family regulatory protein
MPLYEYQCDSCGARFERIQKFSDPPVSECPTCGGPVRKLISSPAIQFKGSGFYITDYAKAGSKGESEKSKKAEKSETKSSGEGSSSESKSDAPASSDKTEKPAASTPAKTETKPTS